MNEHLVVGVLCLIVLLVGALFVGRSMATMSSLDSRYGPGSRLPLRYPALGGKGKGE